MFTKLLIKGKGKIKCRIHLVQVCIRLADACNWTKHQYGDTYVSQHSNPGFLEKLVAPKGAVFSLKEAVTRLFLRVGLQ